MNVTSYITKGYENKSNWAICENKPKQSQNKPNVCPPLRLAGQRQKMLDNVETPDPEYDKPFNKHGSELFRKWPGCPDTNKAL